MHDLLILVVHIITTVFRLARPGGLRAVVAESVLTKHQMLILNRLAFGTSINKDVFRRILALHYQPAPNADGPSWLTFLGHTKDSLWSLALFCCESMTLRTHWVLVVMDHYTP